MLESLAGGQHPPDLTVFHQQHMLAVIGDVFGVVLDDDDGFSLGFVEAAQHLVDPVGVHGVQLGDGLVQNKNVRPQRYRAGQSQQVGLATGQLPDILLLPAFQSALGQGLPAPVRIVRKAVVQTGVGGIVQHGGPDDLIFKILIDIAHLLRQGTHVAFQGVQTLHLHLPPEVPGDKVGDEAIEHFTKGGLPAAVVSNDCQEVPFFDLKRDVLERGAVGARIGIGQAVDLNRVHISRPCSFPRSFS